MKRGEFSEKEIKLIRSVEKEFELFKYKTLSASRKEIFDSCNEIRFYCCIWEYFEYSEDIGTEYINACLKYDDNVIATLYQLYLNNEHLRYERWDDIVEMLEVLVSEQKKYGLPEKEQQTLK